MSGGSTTTTTGGGVGGVGGVGGRGLDAALAAALSTQANGQDLVAVSRTRAFVHATMRGYFSRIGLDPSTLAPRVVHVAGTKGKGSTSAFVESILRAHGLRTGLYTSPHLVDIRERIRLDGVPIPEAKYLQYFWEVWDALVATKGGTGPGTGFPGFFQLMTLVGVYTFAKEDVDAVVLEVGLGGRLDATNMFDAPAVTGVTTLDYDHVQVLGHTLSEIASEKAGIFKPRVPALTTTQEPEAMLTLERVAGDVGAPLWLTPSTLADRTADGLEPTLGLAGDFQVANAALAVSLCDAFFARREGADPWELTLPLTTPLSPAYLAGLAATRFPGRAQIIVGTGRLEEGEGEGCASAGPGPPTTAAGGAPGAGPASTDLTASSAMPSNAVLALDGAHTEKSMRVCARWFHHRVCRHLESAEGSGGGSGGDAASPDGTHHPDLNVLVFNCGHEKSALELLLPLSTLHLHHVLLAPFDASRPSRMGYPDADAVVDMYFAEHALRAGGASVASDASGDSSKGSAGSSKTMAPPIRAVDDSASAPPPPPTPLAWQGTLATLWTRIVSDSGPLLRPRQAELGLTLGPGLPGRPPVSLPSSPRVPEVLPSIAEALGRVRSICRAHPKSRVNVLITGSLYLVGGVLEKL